MRVLAIDTADWKSSVALWEDGQELSFQENTQERSQAALLPLLVKDVLGERKADLLLVNLGPGSFTGIRVGLAFAAGIFAGKPGPSLWHGYSTLQQASLYEKKTYIFYDHSQNTFLLVGKIR